MTKNDNEKLAAYIRWFGTCPPQGNPECRESWLCSLGVWALAWDEALKARQISANAKKGDEE